MDMKEINKSVIGEFRANSGKLSGPMAGAPVLLLTTTGRHSGKLHTTPLGFVDAGGRLAAAAANGGSDQHPDWFHNIRANNQVTIELSGSSVSALAMIAEGRERADLLGALAEGLPGMSDHLSATSREIPVVLFIEAG